MLEVPVEREEEALALLASGTAGARVSETGAGKTRLEVFGLAAGDAEPALSAARAVLRGAGLDPQACGLRGVVVEDGDWVETYRARLWPFRLGGRFIVQPGEERAAPGELEPIFLSPGRAFGTGEHPTTRLCAAALESSVRPGSRWLDLGCGTGILAVVAARCGAARVLALDDDPTAVEVAREVLRNNATEGPVAVRVGSVGDAAPGEWDGVVCNISAGFLLNAMPALSALLKDEGTLIASGFEARDLEGMRESAGRAGLVEIDCVTSASWVALVARRD